MSVNINVVVQSGIVKWPSLKYGSNGQPEFRFTLYRETKNAQGTFQLSIPCCAVSSTAERLASDVDEDDFIVITQGELVYRKRNTKDGPKSRLEILVWRVQMDDAPLSSTTVAARSDPAETPEPSEPENNQPSTKARRRSYPKAALEGGFAQNPN